MKRTIILIFLAVMLNLTKAAGIQLPPDSVLKVKSEKPYNLKLTTRLHSMGQFAYGGRIVSENPVVDFNLNYDRKNWGLQIFKAVDVRDRSTQINFTLAVVNKNFHFGKRLTISPSAGFILEQNRTLADHGSDVVLILNTSYRLSNAFTIDHSTLFGNLVLEPEEKDWVNRVRLTYSKKHLDLSATCWHNNKVFDAAEYLTCGAGAFLSRMKISKSLTVNAGVSLLVMPYSNDLIDYPKKNGVIFTLVAVLD